MHIGGFTTYFHKLNPEYPAQPYKAASVNSAVHDFITAHDSLVTHRHVDHKKNEAHPILIGRLPSNTSLQVTHPPKHHFAILGFHSVNTADEMTFHIKMVSNRFNDKMELVERKAQEAVARLKTHQGSHLTKTIRRNVAMKYRRMHEY